MFITALLMARLVTFETDDIVKRGQAHLRQKGIVVSEIRGLENISRADARAVEQTLIDYDGLGKDGGTLINTNST